MISLKNYFFKMPVSTTHPSVLLASATPPIVATSSGAGDKELFAVLSFMFFLPEKTSNFRLAKKKHEHLAKK